MFLTAAQAADFGVFDGAAPCRDALLDGLPRAAVRVHRRVPIGIELATTQAVTAREIADGAEFDLSPNSRLTWQTKPRRSVMIGPDVLRDNLLKASILFDRRTAVPDKLAFRLRLPADAYLAFQPPLQPWESQPNERGGYAIRPKWVENSYAILTPSRKLGHLYRPFLRDAAGAMLWITMVQTADGFEIPLASDAAITSWLKSVSRQWPVVLDPTFGDSDAAGATEWAGEFENGYQRAYGAYTMAAENGTLNSVSVYAYGTGAAPWLVTLGVFNQASAGEPGTVLAACAEIELSATAAWNTATASGQSLAASTPYCFGHGTGHSGNVYYDSEAGKYSAYKSNTYSAGTLADMTIHTNWTADRRVQYYGTYTASGGGPSIPVMHHHYKTMEAA